MPERTTCEILADLRAHISAHPGDYPAGAFDALSDALSRVEADAELVAEIRDALEGDSNDAEHDALVSVAEHLGITYTPPSY